MLFIEVCSMQNNDPAIHFETFSNGVAAIISAQIKPIQKITNDAITSLNVQEQRNEYLKEINYCVKGILANTSLTSVSLRYIFTPPSKNDVPQFEIVCLIRSNGENTEQAKQRVHHAWKQFESAFPKSLYTLTLVTQKKLLEKIRQPIEVNRVEIIELRKFEDTVPVKYVAAGQHILLVMKLAQFGKFRANYINLPQAFL